MAELDQGGLNQGEPDQGEPDQGDEVVVSVDEPVATVRLNRPNRANSVTPEVVTRLGEAVAELAGTAEIKAVVITGTGKVFCAGADVNEMYLVYQDSGIEGLCGYLADTWMPAVQRTVRLIWGAAKPVVAAFNGAATAGGLDFGLACDQRVASTRAKFAESYVNLGMVPVAGGAYLLPALIGLPRATELLAGGELVDARRAHELGIVEEICEPEELTARARALALKLAGGPAHTFSLLKRIARGPASADLEAALRASYEADVELIARPEVRERIVSVMERYADAAARVTEASTP